MTALPALSPWPAPAPGDVVPKGSSPPTPSAKQPRRAVAALLRTAKRLSSPAERAEYAAAKEEQRISDELHDLPAGWFVLRSLGLDDTDDTDGTDEPHLWAHHVVIGPGGVFLIHLQHEAGSTVWVTEHQLTIDGRDSDRLREARATAHRASNRLTTECGFAVAVQSVLVLIDAATLQALSRPAEVHVRTQHDLRDWLCKQPVRLDPEAVGAVYALGSSTTTGI